MPQQAAPMVTPADPNQNQPFNMDMPVRAPRPTVDSCFRVLLTSDVPQEFGLDFANPLATNDVLNDFDFDSFLHDNEGDTNGFDFAAANFMDPEIET